MRLAVLVLKNSSPPIGPELFSFGTCSHERIRAQSCWCKIDLHEMAVRRVVIGMSAMADTPSTATSIAWMSEESAAGSSPTAIRHLVAAAKQGDTAAFGSLVDLYQQRVFRTATSLLGSESDARDAVQEVFLKAYRYFSKFDDSRELAPWLYKITTNVCRDIARSKRRHQGAPIEVQRLVSTSPGPFERAARREQRHLTRIALARLPLQGTRSHHTSRPRRPRNARRGSNSGDDPSNGSLPDQFWTSEASA